MRRKLLGSEGFPAGVSTAAQSQRKALLLSHKGKVGFERSNQRAADCQAASSYKVSVARA